MIKVTNLDVLLEPASEKWKGLDGQATSVLPFNFCRNQELPILENSTRERTAVTAVQPNQKFISNLSNLSNLLRFIKFIQIY